jgi:hypothetical protein
MSDETTPGQLDEINRRLDNGDERMKRIEDNLATNTAATKRIEAGMSGLPELLEWSRAFEGAFKVLNGIGKLAKPVTYIAGACAAIAGAWIAFKGGGK